MKIYHENGFVNTCKDCAEWTRLLGGPNERDNAGRCSRHGGGCIYTWPDACCPDWRRRRDKLDERAEELMHVALSHWQDATNKDVRALLAKWQAEDKEAR